jgi:DNA-binding MarR family transcriptional regulator
MATVRREPWKDTPPTSQRLVAALGRIATALRGSAWRMAAGQGLTATQGEVLQLLLARPRGARLAWLADQMSITSATASDAVSALVAKGWVEKTRAADDARALSIALTRDGRALARRIKASAGFMESAAQELPAAQQEQLLAGLYRLIGELQNAESFPELRMCVTCEHFEAHRHGHAKAPHHCHLVGAPLPASLLRIDCAEHAPASPALRLVHWNAMKA